MTQQDSSTTNLWAKISLPREMLRTLLPKADILSPVIPQMVVWLGCKSNDNSKFCKVSNETTEQEDPLSKKKYAGLPFNIDGSNGGWVISLGMQLIETMWCVTGIVAVSGCFWLFPKKMAVCLALPEQSVRLTHLVWERRAVSPWMWGRAMIRAVWSRITWVGTVTFCTTVETLIPVRCPVCDTRLFMSGNMRWVRWRGKMSLMSRIIFVRGVVFGLLWSRVIVVEPRVRVALWFVVWLFVFVFGVFALVVWMPALTDTVGSFSLIDLANSPGN